MFSSLDRWVQERIFKEMKCVSDLESREVILLLEEKLLIWRKIFHVVMSVLEGKLILMVNIEGGGGNKRIEMIDILSLMEGLLGIHNVINLFMWGNRWN